MSFFPKALPLMVAAGLLTVVITTFLALHINSLENKIEDWSHLHSSLLVKNQATEQRNEELQLQVLALEEEVRALQQPVAVNGPASFPVSRVLARRDDTVEKLARRESTTVEVVRALNSWLGEGAALLSGQAIWIPNHEK